jgi:hypothetical protein
MYVVVSISDSTTWVVVSPIVFYNRHNADSWLEQNKHHAGIGRRWFTARLELASVLASAKSSAKQQNHVNNDADHDAC